VKRCFGGARRDVGGAREESPTFPRARRRRSVPIRKAQMCVRLEVPLCTSCLVESCTNDASFLSPGCRRYVIPPPFQSPHGATRGAIPHCMQACWPAPCQKTPHEARAQHTFRVSNEPRGRDPCARHRYGSHIPRRAAPGLIPRSLPSCNQHSIADTDAYASCARCAPARRAAARNCICISQVFRATHVTSCAYTHGADERRHSPQA
jgi:hypothetical protein